MVFNLLVFRVHAIQRMYQRVISEAEVRHVIATGETVEILLMTRPIRAVSSSAGTATDPFTLSSPTMSMSRKIS